MEDKFEILEHKKPAGSYCIGNGFYIHLPEKPIWFHRFLMRLCLGWVWFDEK